MEDVHLELPNLTIINASLANANLIEIKDSQLSLHNGLISDIKSVN